MATPENDEAAPSAVGGLSYRAQLSIGVGTLVLLAGLAVAGLAHQSSSATARTLTDALFREISRHAATHAQGFVLGAAPMLDSVRRLADRGLVLDDSATLARQLLAFLEANRGLSWVSYGDEKGSFTGAFRTREGTLRINRSRIVGGKSELVEEDVAPDGSWKVFRRDANSGYDPRKRPFYIRAKEADRLVWLPPYVFFNQGIPGITCAAPVKNAAGGLRGVLTIDFDLDALSSFVASLRVSENSEMFLFTRDQMLLAHPRFRSSAAVNQREAVVLPTLADLNDPLIAAYRSRLASLREIGGFLPFEFELDGVDYLASATAFRVGDDLDWIVGAIAPKSDFLTSVWRSQAFALAAGCVALLGAIFLAAVLASRVSRPVTSLIGFMKRVGDGDLDARADLGGSREFQQLSSALNRMIGDLRDRLRLRHSLGVAMEVQQRLLPQKAPVLRGLDVAGHSTYCDETGGDYYDFLCLDEAGAGRLLVALGDVMGHGIAAALVMAGARAVLRDCAAASGGLAMLMGRINRLLAADHEGTRFMTMQLCIVDPNAHSFRWASAGHDAAILYDPAADRFEDLEGADLPLGIMDDVEYEEHSYDSLRPGHVVTIGTDGVWEMPNTAGEQFGKDRLREVIRSTAARPAAEISDSVRDALAAFRADCKPVDDVTFVIVKVTE